MWLLPLALNVSFVKQEAYKFTEHETSQRHVGAQGACRHTRGMQHIVFTRLTEIAERHRMACTLTVSCQPAIKTLCWYAKNLTTAHVSREKRRNAGLFGPSIHSSNVYLGLLVVSNVDDNVINYKAWVVVYCAETGTRECPEASLGKQNIIYRGKHIKAAHIIQSHTCVQSQSCVACWDTALLTCALHSQHQHDYTHLD